VANPYEESEAKATLHPVWRERQCEQGVSHTLSLYLADQFQNLDSKYSYGYFSQTALHTIIASQEALHGDLDQMRAAPFLLFYFLFCIYVCYSFWYIFQQVWQSAEGK
jgi:hypothetical protein